MWNPLVRTEKWMEEMAQHGDEASRISNGLRAGAKPVHLKKDGKPEGLEDFYWDFLHLISTPSKTMLHDLAIQAVAQPGQGPLALAAER